MIDENINEDLEAQDLSQDVLAVDAANQVLVDDEKPRKKRKSRWAHVTEEENVGRLDYKYEDIVDFEKQLKNLREQLKSGAVKYESLSEKEKEGLKTLEQNLKLKEVKVTPKKSDYKEYLTNRLTGGLTKQQKKISDAGYFGDKDFWENIAYASGGQIGVPETYKPVRKSALGLPDVPLTDREISLMRDPQTGTDASGKERTLRVGEIFYDEASNTYQKWQLKDVKDDAEYMPTEFIGVPLEDAKTVAKLNKENRTQASLSTSGQIYASENGKQYVVENGFWKVKNPGDAYYYFITDPKSIKNVNSYFGQNLPVPDKTKSSELISLNNIDREFVNDVYKTFSNDDEISDWAGLKTEEGFLGTFDDKSSQYETQSKIKSFLSKYGSDYNIMIKADNPYLDQMTGGFTDRFGMTERSITIQTKRGTKRFYIDDDNLIPDIQNFLIANAKPSYTGEAPVKKETKPDKELSLLDPKKWEKEGQIVQPKEGFKISSPDVYNFDQAIISDNTKVYNYFNEINRIEKEKLVAEEKIYGPNAKFLSAEAKEKILLEKNKPILDKERQQLLQIVGNKNLQAATEYITAPNFTPSSYSKDVANALKAENNSIKKKLEDFKKNQSLFAEKQDLITQMGKDAADIKNLALQYKNLISKGEISVGDAEKILLQKQAEFNERYSFVNEKYLQDLQNEQSKLIKDADELSNSASAIELISSNAEYAAGIAMMKSKDQGSFMGGLLKSIVGGIVDIPGFVFGVLGDIEDVGTGAKGKASAGKTSRDAFSGLTGFLVGAGTSEEYEADANLLYKATTGLARSAVQSAVGGNFALFGGGYNEMATQLDKTDMTAAEKILASSIYGTVSMALEKYGLDEIFGKGGMGSSISRYIMKRTVQGLTKDMSKEAVEALVTNEIKLFIADKGIKIAAAGFAEGFTESLQTGAEYGTKATIEAIRGETMFKDAAGNDAVTWRNLGKDALESFVVGAVGGHGVSLISQSASVVSRGMNALRTKEEREALVAAARASGMDELVVANLQASLLSGKYSKKTAQSILENFKIIKQKVNTIPKEMPIREQAVALDLMLERDALNSQIEGVDPALAAPSIERVKEINETLKQIGYAVQESSTESVLQRQQEGTGETGGGREGVEPVVQGKEATEKSSQEKVDVSEGEATPTATVIEAKKADIERRRQEELKERVVYDRKPTVEDGEFRIIGDPNNRIFRINEITGRPQVLDKSNGLWSNTEESPNMFFETTKRSGFEKIKENINVKYDAELAALKTPEKVDVSEGETTPTTPVSNETTKTSEEVATAKEEIVSVYHGGDLTQQEGNLYVSEDANQARSYAKENKGDVTKFEIPKSKIADEQTIKNTLKENNIEVSDEAKLYELIDPRFEETYIGDNAKNNLIDALQQKGFDAAQFTDEDIEGLKKEGVQNIIVFKPESLQQKSIEVKQNRADELFLEGYKPIINGEVKTDFTQQELDDYFNTNETVEMTSAPTQVATEGEIDNIPKFKKNPETEQEFEQQIEDIKEEMNQMPDEVSNFDVPSKLTTKNKTNVKSIISRFADKLKKAWKGGIIKNISEYSGIPMIFTISDQLGAGKVKNEFTGSTIDINGGINFNLTEGNENNAWANTTEAEANKMLSRAKELYEKNKDLFDRLWNEGKLPKGQIPMAVIKMGQESIKTNEALFRFASDTIKDKFNETERTNSLNGLVEDIKSVDPNSKVIKLIKENNFKTIDELLDNVNKLKLGERAIITRFLFTGGIELNKQTKASKPKSNAGLALVGNKDSSYYKYIHLNTINNIIQDESTKAIPPNHVIGIVGVDVLNPQITNPKHMNYPYGVKGGLIGIIESPVHAADVFPEMYSKSFYLNKENKSGKLPSVSQVISQTVASSGAVATTKAFRGSKLSTKITELQKVLGKLKLAFPNVVIVDTQEEFQKALEDENVKKFVKDGDVIYGFTKDGKIFLNPEKANTNTAIHEFSHVWMGFLRKNNPQLLKKGYSLLEGTSILNDKIKEFGDNELAREEAMAELIANRGETIIEAGKKSKFKNWLNALFTYVKSKFKSFDKLSPEEFQNITLEEFVDGSLKSLLKGEEITREEIKDIEVKFKKENNKQDAIQKAKDKYELSVEKRGNSHQQGVTAAIADLQKSDWYAKADDTQRENAVREIKKFFGEKLKAAPSVAKITGKTKDTAVVSDLAAAIRDQIKLEAKAAREATKDINQRRKELGIAIKNVIKNYKGKISEKQLSAINDRISKVNLLNEETVDRVIDYVDKVMKDADYKEKINKAKSARATIKKLKKDSNRQAEVRAMATVFASIDPDLVEDIDEYMAIAEQVKNALKPTSLSISNTTKFSDIYSYVDQYLEGQENIKKERLLSNNPSLVEQGIIDKSMSLKDIESKIRRINEQKNKLNKATNSEELKDNLKGEINSLKDILKAMVFGYNPVTNERVEMTDRIKQVIKEISSLDVEDMTTEQMIALVESLNNFVKNGTIGGLDAAHKTYVGIKNANDLKRKGFVARQLKAYFSPMLGRLLGFEGMSLNELFTRLFGGVTRGNEFMEKSGVAGVVMGVNKAKKMSNAYQELYANTFKNIKGFFDQENVYERGVLAFVYRTNSIKPEEANKEFNRRIDLLLESYESLKNGTAEEQKMAEVYKKVFDRLNIESRDMSVIESNAKQFNIAGAAWWMGTWENHYQDLYDVSLSIYNTDLGSDFYYTSDRLSKLSESTGESIDITNISERGSSFLINTENEEITDKSKAGVLIASTYPATLKDKGRYVNLNFDINQSQALSGALVDIETAGAIRQVDAFISSDSFKSIIPSSSDRSLVVNRINKYIRRSKNKLLVPKDYARVIDKVINEAGRFGTTMALGGVFQFILQTFSVGINTLIQAGKYTQLYTGKSFNDWMNSTGTPTANRGVESVTSIENKMNAIDPVKSTLQQVARQYQKLTQVYMRTFLSKPDVFVARAAWKSYYLKYLSDNGYDTKKINWDTWNDTIKEEGIQDLHKKAMLFAENMVSRQQNVSDERLAGETFASEDGLRKAIRKILLPFAGFSVNQRMRLANDIITLTSAINVASKEDIKIAGRSLVGTVAEQATFNFIKYQVGKLIYYGAMSILGYGDDDEDEEEAKKRNRNALKYPIKSFIGDMASPAPFLDDFVVWAIDKGIKPFMEPSESEINDAVNEENNIRINALGKYKMTEDEKEEFIKKYKEDNTFSLESFKNDTGKYGLISVGSDAYEALYESLKMNDGKYTEEFQGKETEKYLTKDQIESQKIFSALKLFHFIGALPREANQLADKGTRKIKQNSLTKNQYESYKEFTKVFKREPKPYEIDIIKSTNYEIEEGYEEGSNTQMLLIIGDIDDLGGFSNQQGKVYSKLFEETRIQLTPAVYELIQKGKTAEQIKKILSN